MNKYNLNPQAEKVINELIEAEKKGIIRKMYNLSTSDARIAYRNMRNSLSPSPENVYKVKNLDLGKFKARYYRGNKNSHDKILPVMLFFHGGGWVIGDLETHDTVCRQIANSANFDILSIDYGLGPEHPYPAAINHSVNALNWLFTEKHDLPIDNERIGVCGDSAGGNIASVLTLLNRDNLKKNILYQALIYPSTDLFGEYKSKITYDGLILSKPLIKWFLDRYLPEDKNENIYLDWMLSPIKAKNLSDLPPALIAVAECDPLVDEGKEYAKKLIKSGNQVEQIIYKGQIHGFLTMGAKISDANKLIKIISERMTEALC